MIRSTAKYSKNQKTDTVVREIFEAHAAGFRRISLKNARMQVWSLLFTQASRIEYEYFARIYATDLLASWRKVDLSFSFDRNQWTNVDDMLDPRPLCWMFNVRDSSNLIIRSPKSEYLRDNLVYIFFRERLLSRATFSSAHLSFPNYDIK